MKLVKVGLVIITSLALMLSICLPVQADEKSGSVDLSATGSLTVSDVSASNISRHSATISWTTNGDATSQVFYDTEFHDNIADYSRKTDEDTALVTKHSILLAGLSSGTTYHYRVRSAIPGTEFIAISEDYTFKTLSLAPAPSGGISMFSLYDLTIKNITENSADILWETSRSTTSELTYWSNPEIMIESDEYVKEHLVHLEELEDNTTYYFKVTCRDKYGLKKSAEGGFITLEEEIIIPPEPEEPIPPEEPEEPIEPEEPEEEEPEVIEPEEPEEPVEPEEEEKPEELIIEEPSKWSLLDSIVIGLISVVLGLVLWQWKKWMQKHA